MSQNPPVIVLIAKFHCPACEQFEPYWNALCSDESLARNVFYRQFHVGVSANTQYTVPVHFSSFVNTAPSLLCIDYKTYTKYYNINTGAVLNQSAITSYDKYSGPMDTENVKQWILKKIASSRSS